MRRWIIRTLLAFAIFTLGYGLGREAGRAGVVAAAPPMAARGEDKVLVYYLHTTYRCPTCIGIEKLAKSTIESRFGAELAAGRMEWREANYQEREDLAKRYEVTASTVVVVKVENGKEVAWQRLEEVWTLYDQPEPFADYVAAATIAYLKELTP